MLGLMTAQSLTVDECITPKNQSGVCIQISSCSVLVTILQRRVHTKSVEDYDHLKKSFCGHEGKVVKVCCPLEDLSPDIPAVVLNTRTPDKNSNAQSPTICGVTNINRDRIIGGNSAQLGSWPWIAALGYQYINRKGVISESPLLWLCGGSLISNRYVLTAAHCVVFERTDSKLYAVRLGELDLNPEVKDGANPVDIPIERYIVHESYKKTSYVNDIALLKLNRSVTFTKFIQPICLLSSLDMKTINFMRAMPYVAGWGTIYPNVKDDFRNPRPTALIEVQVPLVNTTECKKNYKDRINVIDERVICAGYPKGGKDSCRGDSGGPLMWVKKEQYFLMGVVSYGSLICGQPNSPGVYTSVPEYTNWIINKIQTEEN